MTWKYVKTLQGNDKIVARLNSDGSMESCAVTHPDVQEWIAQGNTPEPADE